MKKGVGAILSVVALALVGAGSFPGGSEKGKMLKVAENQLKEAQSPYLKSAAHQPVAWHPWSEEAFERRNSGDTILNVQV